MQLIYHIWMGFLSPECHILYIAAILQQPLLHFLCSIKNAIRNTKKQQGIGERDEI